MTLFRAPSHPYTAGLLASIPAMIGARKASLAAIDGQPPTLRADPHHCTFSPRCPRSFERCTAEVPLLEPTGADRRAACFDPITAP